MRFVSTPAQDELRARVRAFLADACPPAEVRRLMETDRGYDPAVWREIVAAGWLDLPFADLAVVVDEAGAALLGAPLLGTAVARCVLPDGDPEATVALALAEDSGRWAAEAVTLRATVSAGGGGWRLDGHKSFVVDGWVADTLLVAGRTDTAGVALFAVAGDAPGLAQTRLATLDLTRQQTRIQFSATPARRIGEGDGSGDDFDRVLDVAATLLAAEQVGGAQRCLDMTV
ncbi:MAG: hypothetical protein QOE93_2285, partial [Actinomycetota bacterium]|nr:hypothetical protein [Actinomycetota bacterium]